MADNTFLVLWTDRQGGEAENYSVPVIDQLDDEETPCPVSSFSDSNSSSS